MGQSDFTKTAKEAQLFIKICEFNGQISIGVCITFN